VDPRVLSCVFGDVPLDQDDFDHQGKIFIVTTQSYRITQSIITGLCFGRDVETSQDAVQA